MSCIALALSLPRSSCSLPRHRLVACRSVLAATPIDVMLKWLNVERLSVCRLVLRLELLFLHAYCRHYCLNHWEYLNHVLCCCLTHRRHSYRHLSSPLYTLTSTPIPTINSKWNATSSCDSDPDYRALVVELMVEHWDYLLSDCATTAALLDVNLLT